MSAEVMSIPFSSHYQVGLNGWLLAQMAQYPNQPDAEPQGQYAPLYSNTATSAAAAAAAAGAQQLLDPSNQHDLQYSSLNQPMYSKVEYSGQQRQQHASLDHQQRHSLHHVGSHGQHHHSHTPTPIAPTGTPPQSAHTPEANQKSNRLRKACDSCSIRKVKCDEAGPPCRACAALDIPCTFDRPSRRRGPPNRHAEAIKRRRLEEQQVGSPHGSSGFSSPTNAAQTLASLSSHTSGHLNAESICSIEILDLLIDDFFTYIHPLCPFPHEPTFREAWKNRDDLQNKSFLALLASMVGALVASFPRKPRMHLKTYKKDGQFASHMSLINRCQSIANMARGPGYLENENLNVYDAATSYFMAVMGIYTFRWRQGRLYMAECLTIVRALGLHKAKDQASSQSDASDGGRDRDVDNITAEMGHRIFWTMFVSVKTVQQLGASFSELVIPPPTPTEPYPPLPTEVDDFCIYPTHVEPQPTSLVSMLTGFNANVKAFCSYNALATIEMAWGIDHIVDWERQKRVLHESLRRCKNGIADLPAELIVFANRGPFDLSNGANRAGDQSHMSPAQRNNIEQSPEERRRMQYEIQKANIYASSLSTRFYLVEKFFNLCDAQERARSRPESSPSPGTGITAAGIDGMVPQPPTSHYDMTMEEMRQERESIIKDLLVVLSNIDQVNMEPNANSFTMKIKSIAGTLAGAPDNRNGQLATQAAEYLDAFMKILMKLDRLGSEDGGSLDDDEGDLRQWADLRDYQLKFLSQGGLVGMS